MRSGTFQFPSDGCPLLTAPPSLSPLLLSNTLNLIIVSSNKFSILNPPIYLHLLSSPPLFLFPPLPARCVQPYCLSPIWVNDRLLLPLHRAAGCIGWLHIDLVPVFIELGPRREQWARLMLSKGRREWRECKTDQLLEM